MSIVRIVSEVHYPSLKRLSVTALLPLFLIGCGIPMGRLANRNRDDFPRLHPGMTRAEVIEVMGTRDGVAPQPWRCETAHDSTGNAIEVWYYLMEHPYERSEREYMSPIVLQDGVVLGIGWDFLLRDVGNHYRIVSRRNGSRISRLTEGMTKEELVYFMSHEPSNLGGHEDRNYGIPQPYRTVTHRIPDDGLIEIWYYLVDDPTGTWRLAPVVLKDEVLTGTGWEETRDIAKRYDIQGATQRLIGEHGTCD